MSKIEEVTSLLEKWFKDPIDVPCVYCEASKEICRLFEPQSAKCIDTDEDKLLAFRRWWQDFWENEGNRMSR